MTKVKKGRFTFTLNPDVVKKAHDFLEKQDASLSGLVNYLLSEWNRKQDSTESMEKQLKDLAKRKLKEIEKRKNLPLSKEEKEELKLLLEVIGVNSNKDYNEWMSRNIKEGRHINPDEYEKMKKEEKKK